MLCRLVPALLATAVRSQASKDVFELVSGPFRGFARDFAITFEHDRCRYQSRPLPPALVVPLRIGMPNRIAVTVWASRAGVGDTERKFGRRHDLTDRRWAGWNLIALVPTTDSRSRSYARTHGSYFRGFSRGSRTTVRSHEGDSGVR